MRNQMEARKSDCTLWTHRDSRRDAGQMDPGLHCLIHIIAKVLPNLVSHVWLERSGLFSVNTVRCRNLNPGIGCCCHDAVCINLLFYRFVSSVYNCSFVGLSNYQASTINKTSVGCGFYFGGFRF